MKAALIFAALIACGAAEAQTYVGASAGIGTNNHPWDSRTYTATTRTLDNRSAVAGAFIGRRMGWCGVEAGAFTVPEYDASSYVSDYAAYAGRSAPEFPQTAQIRQTMTGAALYARAQLYAPPVAGFTAYGFGGVAVAFNRNFERGFYNGTDPVSFKESFTNVAPIVGVGVQRFIGRGLSLRLEYMKASGLVRSEHTLNRDADMVSLGLVYQWGGK